MAWASGGGLTRLLQDVAAGRNGGVARRGDLPPVMLVPTEEVLLLTADLPLPTRARRLEALPFAIEERIAESPDAVHLALGAEVGDRRYLVGVVGHAAMARWTAEAAGAALTPDALMLPVPEAGWTVATAAGRVLARRSDGTGFALPAGHFAQAWEAAGRPALAGSAPEGLPVAALDPARERPAAPPLDLRQGRYARPVTASPLRRLAAAAAIGVAAHGLIAAADTGALVAAADRWKRETATEVARLRPGAQFAGDDLATAAADLIPVAAAGGPPGRLLPLVARASTALGPGTAVRRLAFAGDRLAIDVAAADGAALAGVAARLRAAGLVVDQGGLSAGVARVTVRGGA